MARRFLPNKLAHAGRLLVCLPVGLVLGLTVFVALIQVGLFANPFAPRGIGELAQARSDRPGLRVLFVGNSFTFQNATPQLVHRLAAGDPGAPPLFAVQYAAPGWTLRDAAANRGLRSLIGQLHWNDVVLQEQSELLSLPLAQRVRQSYPYARRLNRRIAADHARTVLFQTWGYRDGDRQNRPEDSYVEMQTRLAQGYADLAWRLHATVAPVGVMWFTALVRQRGLDLWAGDGRHPNRAGSYLAACTLYAVLTGRDPAGSSFTDGLPAGQARMLQRIAAAAA